MFWWNVILYIYDLISDQRERRLGINAHFFQDVARHDDIFLQF